jgi:hypothetical protein
MSNPIGGGPYYFRFILNPNQKASLYQINQAIGVITDQSGAPMMAGSYVLQWNLNNHGIPYLSFKINIEIR